MSKQSTHEVTENRRPHYESFSWHRWPEHCQHDNPTTGEEYMIDWLADRFGIDHRTSFYWAPTIYLQEKQ